MSMTVKNLTFSSHGVTCAAWHLPAQTDALAGPNGRPCIVMAHGFGGTRDSGLLAFAEPFAQAGIDAFVFDYRGFGDSQGEPRQHVSVRRQRQDYHAAVATARHQSGVDPNRVVVWGTSYSGGHAVVVAAQDQRIAAAVSLTPATDGLASLGVIAKHAGVAKLFSAVANGLLDYGRTALNKTPHYVPVVGHAGSAAMMTVAGAEEICRAMAPGY